MSRAAVASQIQSDEFIILKPKSVIVRTSTSGHAIHMAPRGSSAFRYHVPEAIQAGDAATVYSAQFAKLKKVIPTIIPKPIIPKDPWSILDEPEEQEEEEVSEEEVIQNQIGKSQPTPIVNDKISQSKQSENKSQIIQQGQEQQSSQIQINNTEQIASPIQSVQSNNLPQIERQQLQYFDDRIISQMAQYAPRNLFQALPDKCASVSIKPEEATQWLVTSRYNNVLKYQLQQQEESDLFGVKDVMIGGPASISRKPQRIQLRLMAQNKKEKYLQMINQQQQETSQSNNQNSQISFDNQNIIKIFPPTQMNNSNSIQQQNQANIEQDDGLIGIQKGGGATGFGWPHGSAGFLHHNVTEPYEATIDSAAQKRQTSDKHQQVRINEIQRSVNAWQLHVSRAEEQGAWRAEARVRATVEGRIPQAFQEEVQNRLILKDPQKSGLANNNKRQLLINEGIDEVEQLTNENEEESLFQRVDDMDQQINKKKKKMRKNRAAAFQAYTPQRYRTSANSLNNIYQPQAGSAAPISRMVTVKSRKIGENMQQQQTSNNNSTKYKNVVGNISTPSNMGNILSGGGSGFANKQQQNVSNIGVINNNGRRPTSEGSNTRRQHSPLIRRVDPHRPNDLFQANATLVDNELRDIARSRPGTWHPSIEDEGPSTANIAIVTSPLFNHSTQMNFPITKHQAASQRNSMGSDDLMSPINQFVENRQVETISPAVLGHHSTISQPARNFQKQQGSQFSDGEGEDNISIDSNWSNTSAQQKDVKIIDEIPE